MNKTAIIFSGFNSRAVLAFLRTLETTHTKYAVIAKSESDEILLSDYRDRVLAIRNKTELDLNDLISCIKKVQQSIPSDKYVIAPSTEALNRYLLDKQTDFESINCEIPLVGKELYERVSDKEAFSSLCKENSISVPNHGDSLKDFSLPFVAKPKKYYSSNGKVFSPILFNNENEVTDFLQKYNEKDFFFQQFIGGQSQYLLYYFYENGEFVKLSQANYIQQAEGKSIVAAEVSDFSDDQESASYEKLFKSLNFRGLVMVEVKCNEDGKYMIEANPRFWGPSQLFIDAGVNLFEAFLYDWDLKDSKPTFPAPNKAKYLWLGGVIETLAQNKELAYHSYEPEDFAKNLIDWLKADIYNRDDSRQIFINQIGFKR